MPERIWWNDSWTKKSHTLVEEGHLFRWTCTYEDEEGKTVALDYGLVPGGVFVALLHLVDGPTLKQVQALETEMGGAE